MNNDFQNTKRICIADFDDTLITVDSLVHIMKREKWIMRPRLIAAGFGIVMAGLHLADKMKSRSSFKKLLLEYLYALPGDKYKEYVSDLKARINESVIEDIMNNCYDSIVIVSASEKDLIKDVIGDIFPDSMIIANSLPKSAASDKPFETCYGANKVKRLSEQMPDYPESDISVYTDSWSDRPLIDIAAHAYMINGNNIETVK